mgnify:CR=1 FL=1
MLDDISLFIKLYEVKSFKGCAELVNTSPSTISKHITELEYKLGKQLIRRTTKTFEPTPYGTYIYNNLKNIPVFTESVIKSYNIKRKSNSKGNLNVTLGSAISYELISPYLDEFLEQHPNVKLNVNFKTNITSWPSEDTNLVLGISAINDSSLDSRFIRTEKARLYCTKDYIQKYGLPEKPDELIMHRVIGFIDDKNFNDNIIMYNSKSNATLILDLSNIKIKTNDLLHMKKIGMDSNYIFGSNDSVVSKELQNGHIVPVLPDWYISEVDFYIITKKSLQQIEQSFIYFISNCMNKSYNRVMLNSISTSRQIEQ